MLAKLTGPITTDAVISPNGDLSIFLNGKELKVMIAGAYNPELDLDLELYYASKPGMKIIPIEEEEEDAGNDPYNEDYTLSMQ